MIVRLFDGRELIISDERGRVLVEALARGKSVIIDKQFYNPKAVAYTRPGGLLEPDREKPPALPEPRATKSSKGFKKFQAERKKFKARMAKK